MITQASIFPKGKHDDLVDSMTQAISYLRSVGLAQTDERSSLRMMIA
jgi:phage terminase large subunit-like protein